MRNSFRQFENSVRVLCDRQHFKTHREELKDIYISSYDCFVTLIKRGLNIRESKKACEKLFEISNSTGNTEEELLSIFIKLSQFIQTKQL
jgi:hypothetical protein